MALKSNKVLINKNKTPARTKYDRLIIMSRRLTLKSNLIKQDVLKNFHVAVSVLASFEFATACHEIKVSRIRSKRIVFLEDLLGKPLHFA